MNAKRVPRHPLLHQLQGARHFEAVFLDLAERVLQAGLRSCCPYHECLIAQVLQTGDDIIGRCQVMVAVRKVEADAVVAWWSVLSLRMLKTMRLNSSSRIAVCRSGWPRRRSMLARLP